jgi:hypothetical protein
VVLPVRGADAGATGAGAPTGGTSAGLWDSGVIRRR